MEGKNLRDLEERTQRFGEEIISFTLSLKKDTVTEVLKNQLVRSGTSVGANYCEADCSESKKDFVHKISIANKEAKESKHWLRMIVKANPEKVDISRTLWKEADELNKIFSTIVKNTKYPKD